MLPLTEGQTQYSRGSVSTAWAKKGQTLTFRMVREGADPVGVSQPLAQERQP